MVIFPHILWVCSNRLTWQQFPPERSALLDFHLRFRAKVLKQRFAGLYHCKIPQIQTWCAYQTGATGNISKISHFDPETYCRTWNRSLWTIQRSIDRQGRSAMSARIIWVEKMRASIATTASMNLWWPVSQPCLCCQILFTASSNGYRPGRLEAMWLLEWTWCNVWGSIGKLPSFTWPSSRAPQGTPGISYPSRRPHLQTWKWSHRREESRGCRVHRSCLVKAGHHWNLMQHLATSSSSTPKFGSWLRCLWRMSTEITRTMNAETVALSASQGHGLETWRLSHRIVLNLRANTPFTFVDITIISSDRVFARMQKNTQTIKDV